MRKSNVFSSPLGKLAFNKTDQREMLDTNETYKKENIRLHLKMDVLSYCITENLKV